MGRLLSISNLDSQADAVLSALASQKRRQILALLGNTTLSVTEIAEKLGLPQSSATTHIKILREAGLLSTRTESAERGGTTKLCSLNFDAFVFELTNGQIGDDKREIEVEMPVGLYVDFEVSPTCGLCSPEKIFGKLYIPQTFLSPERSKAALLWFAAGYVEYKFPMNLTTGQKAKKLELSFEACSEAPGSNRDWPSDITVWVNGHEIGTWKSPSDFGGVRGKLTPLWWRQNASQYGLMKTWSVTDYGSFIDGDRSSTTIINSLGIEEHHSIRVRIGIKADAEHMGGMNLFGRQFGNYDQDIVLRIWHE